MYSVIVFRTPVAPLRADGTRFGTGKLHMGARLVDFSVHVEGDGRWVKRNDQELGCLEGSGEL